jgi:hypothetical protein
MQERHALLELRYKRRIQCAPAKKQIVQHKITRDMWISVCREQLDEEERVVAQREMVVPPLPPIGGGGEGAERIKK